MEVRGSVEICEKLKLLGYAQHNRIRMYGEEFDLTANPVTDEDGIIIEAVSRKSGVVRMLRLPLTIVNMISKDIAARVTPRRAA